MDNNHSFYFRPWHFLLAIVIFVVLTGIVAQKKVKDIPLSEKDNSILTELHEINLDKKGITFLFFYRKDSELCQKMRYNIEQLDAENLHGIHFYAMDIEENAEYYYKYNISGIPNLLIFNGDIEIKRVMGVVSTNNLEKIVNRIKPY
ncbi:TRX family [Proteiniphilum saccharofermentans]|uniref:TRX family n=1 Tax=Proteiniphilum saccharofermentans TaxID=1642647 RepID=A0A1R3T084_9BACT|nr:thioredoxin family protein [Proteiniphilum saccharofermentans]SCD21151.1 TRX family [Proteiniphilum saccharofermentans]